MEHSFQTSNMKKLWDTMKTVTNMNPEKKQIIALDEQQKSNELNDFYLRFDSQDFSLECNNILQSLPDSDSLLAGSGPT